MLELYLKKKKKKNTETYFKATVWIFIEPTIGIISACLPFFGGIMGRMIPQALEYISQTSSKMRSLWAESSRGSDPNTNMSRTRKHNTKLVSANNRYDPEENELSLYSVQVTANVPSNTESVKSLV